MRKSKIKRKTKETSVSVEFSSSASRKKKNSVKETILRIRSRMKKWKKMTIKRL